MNVRLRNVLCNSIAANYWLPVGWRVRLLRAAGMEIGEGTAVRSRCVLAGPAPLRIGAGGYIGNQCLFDLTGAITLGDHVYVGARTSIATCTHDIGEAGQRAGRQYPDPVHIGAGSWIGMGVTILPGVTIERGCIIAAGAVVSADCTADGMYAGVPARRVMELARRPVAA